MDLFYAGVDLLQKVVYLLGGGIMIGGLVEVGQGRAEGTAGQRNLGIGIFIGGVAIFMVGYTLVPMLKNLL